MKLLTQLLPRILGQADASTPEKAPLFVRPLEVGWKYWYLLLLPLCLAVSVVYKSIKCRTMRQVPREALVIFVWILVGMGFAAGVLAGVVRVLEK